MPNTACIKVKCRLQTGGRASTLAAKHTPITAKALVVWGTLRKLCAMRKSLRYIVTQTHCDS